VIRVIGSLPVSFAQRTTLRKNDKNKNASSEFTQEDFKLFVFVIFSQRLKKPATIQTPCLRVSVDLKS